MEKKNLSLSLAFSTRDVKLKQSIFGTSIHMDDSHLETEPGAPGFPTRYIHVALPVHYEAVKVKCQVIRTEPLTDSPTFVIPARKPGISKRDFDGPGVPVDKWVRPDMMIYSKRIQTMKQKPVRLAGKKIEGRIILAELAVQPVRYNNFGALEMITEMNVILTLQKVKIPHPRIKIAGQRQDWSERRYVLAANRVVNPQLIEKIGKTKVKVPLSGDPASGDESNPVYVPQTVDYLIITDDNTWDANSISPLATAGNLNSAFARLAAWKKSRGLRTHVATVSNIVGGSYGNFKTGARDLQEVIRNFLKDFVLKHGTDWVLLGGDVSIIPARRVCGSVQWGCHGFAEAETEEASGDKELPKGSVVWKGTFLGMRVDKDQIGDPVNHILTMLKNGTIVPYDSGGPSGTSNPRWYHTTDDTFSTFSATRTEYIRVDGNASLINGKVQWYTEKNLIPADFYYASLFAPEYGKPGKHDWDLTGNGLYGQWSEDTNLDGIDYQIDAGLGRAPVQTVAEADIFIDKLIDYEKASERPQDYSRFRRMLFVGDHFQREFRRIKRDAGDPMPPANNKYSYKSANSRSVVNADVLEKGLNIELISYVSETDYRIIPYAMDAGPAKRGWYYAKSDTDLNPSYMHFDMLFLEFDVPVPTRWIVIYSGIAQELTPIHFVLDSNELDTAIKDQEELRENIRQWFYRIDNISRLYTDEPDLSMVEMTAAPVKHLTADTLREELDHGPHFVSLSGHGSSGGCCYYDAGMLNSLGNGNKTFIVFADSCSTNAFDVNDAVSERSVIESGKGAVAYIGYSRYGWIGAGPHFRTEFFRALSIGARHLAQLNDSRFLMASWGHGYRWQVVEQNLIGDPEMPVWKDDHDVRMAYVANTSTRELHERNCQWVERMSIKNRLYLETKTQGLSMGFDGCGFCLREHHTR